MRAEQLSILWLCGPPGAGKSAVGWALYDELVSSGARASFVDIDQIGMCLPAPAGDPERYRLKLRNMAAVVPSFRAAGCDALIMPGHLGLDPALSSRTVDGADLTACRLRASPDELRRRLTARRVPDLVAASLRDAAELDRSSFADACVDTDGLTVAEVARLVRERGRVRRLVLSGPVPDARAAALYARALPAANVTVGRLHASAAELARRIARRGQGLSWPEPGDPLIGRPAAQLRLAAERAVDEAQALDQSGLGDLRIDTDGLSVREAADQVGDGWQAFLKGGRRRTS